MKNELINQAVLRYLEIMPAEEYRMTLIPEDEEKGKAKIIVKYRPESLRKAVSFLDIKNQQGYHIYCRPLDYRYIMLDDLIYDPDQEEASRKKFEELAKLKPCMLIRTSRMSGTMKDNYQAWFKLSFEPDNYDHALEINRYLQQKFDTDPGGIGPHQPARLPGYKNVKAKYLHNGNYPRVEIRKSIDRVSTITHRGERAQTSEQPKSNQTGSTRGISKSHVDFAIACKMIREGKDDFAIIARLEENLRGRRKGRFYIQSTIRNARKAVAEEAWKALRRQ
jgi:hypothetical protein